MNRQTAHLQRIQRVRDYWRAKVAAHLCDRALVTGAAWKAMFLKLVDHVRLVHVELGRTGEPADQVGFDPREPLVWAWCVLETMPNDQQQRYQALKERAADGSGIEEQADVLRSRGYAMEDLKTALSSQVSWLAALARALDDDLAALQYWPDDILEWDAEDWRPPGYACFVVPVERPFRLGNGRSAQRRALRSHAVLPDRIGSLPVLLHLHPDAAELDSGPDPKNWIFGAATFPTMTVVPEEIGADGFRLISAPIEENETAAIRTQVTQGRGSGADVMVWPELSMPENRLELLKLKLADDPLAGGRIPIVVAGSWHVKCGGTSGADDTNRDTEPAPEINQLFVNRCEVLLGDGEPILSYDKRRRFPFRGRTEEIETGEFLPIIVMEDRLIGVAICRDNCDDVAREGYGELPIDLVIVPSMGGDSTVEAHDRHAKAQRSKQGTLTLVVQQALAIAGEPRPTGPPAFSFIAPPSGDAGDEIERAQAELFRTLGGKRAA